MTKTLKIILVISLVVIVTALGSVYYFSLEKGETGDKRITVEVVFKDGAKKTFDIRTDEAYLGTALAREELVGVDTQSGMINMVDGVTADDSVMEWWKFSKDGEMLMTGADTTPIADGDKFEITLMVGWDDF